MTEASREKLKSQMARNERDVVVECSVVVGHRQECLLRAAEQMDADMTVLGSVPLRADARGLERFSKALSCSFPPRTPLAASLIA